MKSFSRPGKARAALQTPALHPGLDVLLRSKPADHQKIGTPEPVEAVTVFTVQVPRGISSRATDPILCGSTGQYSGEILKKNIATTV